MRFLSFIHVSLAFAIFAQAAPITTPGGSLEISARKLSGSKPKPPAPAPPAPAPPPPAPAPPPLAPAPPPPAPAPPAPAPPPPKVTKSKAVPPATSAEVPPATSATSAKVSSSSASPTVSSTPAQITKSSVSSSSSSPATSALSTSSSSSSSASALTTSRVGNSTAPATSVLSGSLSASATSATSVLSANSSSKASATSINSVANATSTASPTSVVANSTSTTLATSAVANSTSTASATSAAANSTSTASANNTSCPLPGANGRRGLPALPNNLDLVLNGVTRQLQKNDDQGNSGDTVFQVVGTQDNGAFAKTPGAANANDFANEAALTDQVGQAIARGPDSCGRQWLVIKRAPGTPLQFTSTWQASIKKSAADCQADLANVIDKIVATAGQFVTSFGVMHNDLQPENVFFTDDLSSSTLIDWGRGTQVGKQFTAALQQTARQQATFSYRNLCDASQFGFRR